MKIFAAFFVMLAAGTHARAAVDLKSYVEKAVGNSPTVRQAELDLTNAELDQTNAHRFFLPRLDLTSTIGKTETDPPTAFTSSTDPSVGYQPNTSPLNTSQLNLGLTSTLLDSWNSVYRWDQTGVKTRQMRLTLERARDQVALDAAKRFLTFSQNYLNDQIAHQGYDILKKQANLVSGQYRQGLRTRKDDLRFQSQLRSTELSLAASEAEIAKAKNALRNLDPSLNLDDVLIEKPKADLKNDDVRIIAVDDHRDLKIIRLGQEVRGYQERIDHKRLGPDLGVKVAANYGLQNFTTPDPRDQFENRGWSALLTIQWNLFDWGERRRQNEILLNTNLRADQDDETTLRKLAEDLADLGARTTAARKSVQLSNELLGMEEISYHQLEVDYREGKANYLDLITALQELTTSRRQSSDSQFDWMNIRLESLYHQGRLYEQITR